VQVEITRRECATNRAQVFYALSLKPRDTADWDAMREARDRVACDPQKN
jgi:hypothetical protein